jgi:hypothetical protein
VKRRLFSLGCALSAALLLAAMLAAGCSSRSPAGDATPYSSPVPPVEDTATLLVPHTPTFTPAPAGDDVVILTDPLVEETYYFARQDLADWLGTTPESIELVEWTSVVWQDASLGCPQEGRDYERAEVPGYRLVLGVGDEHYYYHADFTSAARCDAEDEVLPE